MKSQMLAADVAYRGGVRVTELKTTIFLQAWASAAFADIQVRLMRELATRLRTSGTAADHTLAVEAAADQLEAAARETLYALRRNE